MTVSADLFTIMLVGATSIGAYVVGRRVLGLSLRGLAAALGGALEAFGLVVLFFTLNIAAGVAVVLLRRTLGGGGSLYFVDEALLALSLVQGLTLHCWRRARADASGPV